MASAPRPGEFAAHTDQPTTANQSTVVAPASRYPASRENRVPIGSTTGITAIGASMQNNGVSSTRPCMKSPPWRIQ